MIFHNYFVFELRISKLVIFEEVTYSWIIKVFLFVLGGCHEDAKL